MSDLLELIDNNKKEFEVGTKKLVYSFQDLTIEQTEIAAEIAVFHYIQSEQMDKVSFETFIKSNAPRWRLVLLSYLLLEEKDGQLIPFEEVQLKEKELLVKKIKNSDRVKVKEALDDFFTKSDLQEIISSPLQRLKNKRAIEMLFNSQILSQTLTNNDKKGLKK